ncbi:M16 family metallopeptidase [Rhodoligotrophos defluvii]|uniref:M16 family metallopeptidase n=1 Tax=Rhodoligotrophos defluvii TaxID=2561934 RepID=UPI001EF0204F|nr:pitrilysin family protein [Rhodoligotrophos defluvii]
MNRIATLKRQASMLGAAFLMAFAAAANAAPAAAVEIQEVKTPGGLTAWLVEDHTVPIIAMNFAFRGGSALDPQDKRGLATFLAATLDEGAGDLDSQAFQQALESTATKLSFEADRDDLSGRLQTLASNRDRAFDLLKLAVNDPRFDAEPVERMRARLLASVRSDATDPENIASEKWLKLALGDHAYVNKPDGTVEGLQAVTADDLRALRNRIFNKAGLKIAVVGAIDAKTLAPILDEVFGALPATGDLASVPEAQVRKGNAVEVVAFDIPQSVIMFGTGGLKRDDPDFIPAYVMNSILGGSGFGSRLTEEVREKRGLTYSVYSALWTLDHAGLFIGGAATRNDRAAETVKVIQDEIARMAKDGPTEKELAEAKTYLTGAYALRFDSNAKIARELLGIQLNDLGIDYINKRNRLVEAVTLEDVKRAARRVLDSGDLLVTVVGKPDNLTSTGG